MDTNQSDILISRRLGSGLGVRSFNAKGTQHLLCVASHFTAGFGLPQR